MSLVKCLCLWVHQGNAMWLLVLVDPECGVHGDHTVELAWDDPSHDVVKDIREGGTYEAP